MNTKLFKLLTAGTLALLLSACGEDAASEYDGDAVLSVFVRDYTTGEPVEAASLELLASGATGSTNGVGLLSFNDVLAGAHKVLAKKDGYASAIYEAQVHDKGALGTSIVELYPLTASLDGYLLYEDNGTSKPAKDAVVKLILGNNYFDIDFVEKVLTTTADADGKFVFPKLPPVGSSYSIQASGITKEGKTYNPIEFSNGYNFPLIDGSSIHIGTSLKYTGADVAASFELLSCTSDIKSTDAVSLVFSDNIDKEGFENGMVYANNTSSIYDVIVENNTVKLVPLNEWVPHGNYFYAQINDLKSVSGKILDYDDCIIYPTEKIPSLTGQKVTLTKEGTITATSMSVDLKWDKMDGAEGYILYARASAGTGEFVELDYFGPDTKNTTVQFSSNSCSGSTFTCSYSESCYDLYGTADDNLTCPFAGTNSVDFILQAYNSTTRTMLTGAVLNVKP